MISARSLQLQTYRRLRAGAFTKPIDWTRNFSCATRTRVLLRKIDLNLFVTLDALIRERNLTRAGRRVGTSQPAMSAALGRLRGLFDDPLLVRVGREYRLTPRARELAQPLHAALASLERTLHRDAAFDPASAQREFRIASSDATLLLLLQPLVERLSKVAPGIRLHLRVADAQVPRRLASGEIDLSIQPAGVLTKLPSQDLFTDHWVCAVWRGNTSVGECITKQQWLSLPHASYGMGRSGLFLGDFQLGKLASERSRTLICESFLALPLMLRGTQLVATLPSRLAALLQPAADLRLLALPYESPEFVECMAWSPLYSQDPGHQWLRSMLVELAREL